MQGKSAYLRMHQTSFTDQGGLRNATAETQSCAPLRFTGSSSFGGRVSQEAGGRRAAFSAAGAVNPGANCALDG
ncbi:hypothetical protein SBA2_170026 [Acidobacteriia bacterium SbA2]|nr:hypothetical protein SBA2_170026 [Acidobacteriia bacterium SbA2]